MLFIISFYLNKNHNRHNWPTHDMYNCLSYIFNKRFLTPNKLYKTNNIKIKINIGKSKNNIKHIDLGYFDNNIKYTIVQSKKIEKIFKYKIENNILIIENIKGTGWKYSYNCIVIFNKPFNLYLYEEYKYKENFVKYGNTKILNSRDNLYVLNNGW
jgi:hypothetical protein